MSADLERLEQECRTFTRFLSGAPATPYVITKYVEAHNISRALDAVDGFERTLVARASSGPLWARLADAYAGRVMPKGVLRKKLVLLLAILETSADFHRRIDTAPARSVQRAVIDLAVHGAVGIAAVLAGLVVFGALRLTPRSGGRHS